MPFKKPLGIVVRRGALRRFDALTRKIADLPVVLMWDRRTRDRRTSLEPASVEQAGERRAGDRRGTPAFTWDAADFVVVDAAEAMAPQASDGRTGEAAAPAGHSESHDPPRASATPTSSL